MLNKRWLDLQLFGEGGDGGDAGGEAGPSESTGVEVPAHIPERARKNYEAAMTKSRPAPTQPTTEVVEEKPSHIPYAEMIKSDEYKEEHKAYMDKTIGDRLKKYKGLEESYNKATDALGVIANKYGLDPSADNFLDSIVSKIDEDNSYFEQYAMDHDISTEEAKEIITLKNKVAKSEQEKALREQQERMNNEIMLLRQSAERTKSVYPNFDLETEMQNEQFRNLCAVTHGDTLAAYRTIHHDELMRAQGMAASQRAQQQIANSVAANMSRPIENGMSSKAAALTTIDYSKMNLRELRETAERFRRGEM